MTTMPTAPSVVELAVAAVRDQFAGHPVNTVSDGVGGVFVTIEDIDLGSTYTPNVTWLGFHINAAYPHSDVYPHYIGRVTRLDNQARGRHPASRLAGPPRPPTVPALNPVGRHHRHRRPQGREGDHVVPRPVNPPDNGISLTITHACGKTSPPTTSPATATNTAP